jgi:uncharacterized coiled-coil protein SlyX
VDFPIVADTSDWGSVVAAVVGLTGTIFAYLVSVRSRAKDLSNARKNQEQFREGLSERLADQPIGVRVDREAIDNLAKEIASLQRTTGSQLSKEDVDKEVETAVTAFSARLERIEQRFPDTATIDKIASINDAVFATKIEQLQKSLEQIDAKVLSKWDVATIVFAVIGAVGVIAGAIFTVANFLK